MGIDERIKELQEKMEEAERTMQLDEASRHQAQYERALAQRMVEEQDKVKQQVIKTMPMYSGGCEVTSSGTYTTNREHGDVAATIHTKHENGFWSKIKIHEDDFVFYKLFRGGNLERILCKMRLRKDPTDTDGCRPAWDYVTNQGHKDAKLEATLGKTYLRIDEKIAEELEEEDHRKFIRGIASTDPENLKMIAGLKNLDDGMKAPLEDPQERRMTPLNGTSGSITIAKKQASAGLWNSDQGSLISSGADEIIRVDPDSTISFGEKMTKAIRKVMEAPETGKAP